MQAVGMPWFRGLILKTVSHIQREGKGRFWGHQLWRNNTIKSVEWKMNHETFPFNLPLMDKISMNENQRTSFHFYRHKILLVIRRGWLIKVHPIFPSKKPSGQAILKHNRAGKRILDKENSHWLVLLARQKRNRKGVTFVRSRNGPKATV